MTIALGIDTGGTYTDAALVDQDTGCVLGAAKALTTRHDLSIGIGQAVQAVLERSTHGAGAVSAADVELVGLSTTLATNAIVEGQGGPVCLLLIGYDPSLIERYGRQKDLVTDDVVYLRGGHDAAGNQVAPLDESAARAAILSRRDQAEAFAISGYFGVRNPAHELRVRELVEELTAPYGPDGQALPVTCGHELTSRLDAVRRATTVALNASLIPLLRELISTVRHTLDDLGVAAPLMIVKGDGSLVRAEWAMQRPVETILSGPAASVVGAWHLGGREDVWVVDVGGTTTDIAVLRKGRPRLNPEGARVGRWRTMIEAADVHTVGLGGDSHVRLDGNRFPGSGGMTIGPRRVVPLCLLAAEYPRVMAELKRQLVVPGREGLKGQFVLALRRSTDRLPGSDAALVRRLSGGPEPFDSLADEMGYGPLVVRQVEELVARRLLLLSSFTPTDALHVLGRFREWDAEASRLAAQLLARRAGMSPEAFCEQVVTEVSNQVTRELVTKVLSDEVSLPNWHQEPSAVALLARAMGVVSDSDLACELKLRHPVVAVGAPVEAYLPRTVTQLGTELVIPHHAQVANAIGAVAGGVVQRLRVLIQPIEADQAYRAYLPDGVRDFSGVEEAVTYAREAASEHIRRLAQRAGAHHIELQIERIDRVAPVQVDWGKDIYVETELVFTAAGRPSLAHEGLPES
jgi:N-methylhydantoinase A/oxoprolinase/acetone carboxylase beta subunit